MANIPKRDLKIEILEARNVLERMYVERDELEIQISRQKRVVSVLTELANLPEDSIPSYELVNGFTDACKAAVLGADKPLYPSEVCKRIKMFGIPKQKNILASVHTVLKRLAEYGAIEEVDGAYWRLTSKGVSRKPKLPMLRSVGE